MPESCDFEAWRREHDVCVAIDWDGTCKDTMVAKWTRGFNVAMTQIWPELRPYQQQVDDVCYRVNIVEETAGVMRFVSLKLMMKRLESMGLPVPDLERFFRAVDAVEQRGEMHGVETYMRLQKEFGYDDSPIRWSNLSDHFIAFAVKEAPIFDHCKETLESLHEKADLVVVSAAKSLAVRQDLLEHDMAGLFKALCGQDFLPKKGILAGLVERYARVMFIGDTQHDVRAAHAAGIPIYLVVTGDEAASWLAAGPVIERWVAGEQDMPELVYPPAE